MFSLEFSLRLNEQYDDVIVCKAFDDRKSAKIRPEIGMKCRTNSMNNTEHHVQKVLVHFIGYLK